jgi:peptide/nickel transport system substrate-binding protein
MPSEMLKRLPGYDPDVKKEDRERARKLLQSLGYGPDKRLPIKIAARNIPLYRDPAVILIDQLKEMYIDGELELIETANWFPKLARKDYMLGLENQGSGVDDPDQQFYENYACGADRNITGYCNPELDNQFAQQSVEADQEKRKQLVWQIDTKLQEDGARLIIYHLRGATCWQPWLKGLTSMSNSIYNGYRYEDIWLDK